MVNDKTILVRYVYPVERLADLEGSDDNIKDDQALFDLFLVYEKSNNKPHCPICKSVASDEFVEWVTQNELWAIMGRFQCSSCFAILKWRSWQDANEFVLGNPLKTWV